MCMLRVDPKTANEIKDTAEKNSAGLFVFYKVVNVEEGSYVRSFFRNHVWVVGENVSNRESFCTPESMEEASGVIKYGFHAFLNKEDAIGLAGECGRSRKRIIKVTVNTEDIVEFGKWECNGRPTNVVFTKCHWDGTKYPIEDWV